MFPTTALILLWLASLLLIVRVRERQTTALLGVLAAVSVWNWTHQGSFHDLGKQHANLHVGEAFHYYLGSRYFGEVGHYDLYTCSSVGYDELGRERRGARAFPVRNLHDKLDWDTLGEVRASAQACHAAFGDRWAPFKDDLASFLDVFQVGGPGFLRTILGDAGYNSSPAFAMLYGLPFRDVPVSSAWWWIGWVDLALVAVLALVLGRVGGWRAAAGLLFVFGANPLALYSWIGGSWFRLAWFVALGLALLALRKERWFLAGILLGYVTMERGFPVVFAVGATVALARDLGSSEGRRRLAGLIGGGVVAGGVLGLSSAAVFGLGSWLDFWENARAHGDIFWIPHIGLAKAVAYDPTLVPGNFRHEGGAAAFAAFEAAYRERLFDRYALYLIGGVTLLVTAAIAAVRDPRIERGTLTFGVTLLFVLTRPAGYYFVLVALFAAVDLSGRVSIRDRVQALATLGLLGSCWAIFAHAPQIVARFDHYSLAMTGFLAARIGIGIAPAWLFEGSLPDRLAQPQVPGASSSPSKQPSYSSASSRS